MAQLPAPNTTGVAMGHLHLKSKDAAGNRKFWVDTLGGTPAKVGPLEFYKFPDVLVMITAGEHKGGSEGSAINHLGFKVNSLDAYIEKCKADGWEIVKINMETRQLFVMSPDKIKVELSEDKTMKVPIAHHHIHWSTVAIADTQAWYVKMFGAIPGKRLSFEAADVPGANLTFTYTRLKSALSEVTYAVEWSDTLSSWSTTGVTEQILSDDGTLQQVQASIPANGAPRRFVHLKLTR